MSCLHCRTLVGLGLISMLACNPSGPAAAPEAVAADEESDAELLAQVQLMVLTDAVLALEADAEAARAAEASNAGGAAGADAGVDSLDSDG